MKEPTDVPVLVADDPAVGSPGQRLPNGRREARVKRRESRREAAGIEATSGPSEQIVAGSLAPSQVEEEAQEPRRGASRIQQRPRAPRAERHAAHLVGQGSARTADTSAHAVTDPSHVESDALDVAAGILVDPKGKGSARVAARARKRQHAAATAVDNAGDNPTLGALNRHLNMMMQQLTAAHRVIGRVAAERDALRQQLADLQGIPVEEIVVSTIGASAEVPTRPVSAAEPSSQSRLARLNYFGGDDIALMRKRRQTFVLILVGFGAILAVVARQIGWSMPEDVSRDSLSALPILGNLMTVFLAGWVIFRIVRVGGKGVRWVFPTEDRRRRRR